ncbi:unnamed protein product [Adineta ricciae]|uniref:Uncharacterized protein n=1 Tax=Adineta ricciae TaxID=249248 RepID=A0A815LPZ1_ADIRI|nr:unnamed protein product [Adineta ricciae]
MACYIDASIPSGNGRRITLLGTDLIFASIDNVFVYPTVDVDRLRNALSETLSLWPILTGRIIVNDDEYMIECSDNSVPFNYIENNELECWPDLPVVVDDKAILEPFIDSVQYKTEVEPLLRFKVTYLLRSKEYIVGTSTSHLVGDAYSNIRFLNNLSQIYQHLEPLPPRPIFQRCLLNKEKVDLSFPLVKEISEKAEKIESFFGRIIKGKSETEQINLSFSSEQLIRLHSIGKCDDEEVTIHDTLCAYIIITLNKYFFLTTDEHIQRARMIVNYRGTCDSLVTQEHVGNYIISIPSSQFTDSLSLSSTAKMIRQAIKTIRSEDFLEKWLVSADVLTRQLIKDGRVNYVLDQNEVIFNSNLKYDWANEVNLGMINQCRFHTATSFKFYFRIFQLNPIKGKDGRWTKDNGGAQVAVRIPKGERKDKFLEAWAKDIQENFANVTPLEATGP